MFACCSESASRKRKGYVLVFGSLIIALILVPIAGLAVDLGLTYLVQSRLWAAADAATVAGAGALGRGADDAAQRANAEATADSYFSANFPSGSLRTTNLQVTSTATTDATHIRSVTTTASLSVPLIFLRMFHVNTQSIQVTSKATRRDVNLMIIMDRSGSLSASGACTPLKAAAVNFVDKFADGRDVLGLITFGTSSRVDFAPAMTFKASLEAILNNVNCTGGTNSAQALWQGYQQLVALNQSGALNAIVFFTDGRPTAINENFPVSAGSPCQSHTSKQGVLTPGYNQNVPVSVLGLYVSAAPQAPPLASDQTVITNKNGCNFSQNQSRVANDLQNAPTTDYWGNSLTATGYRSVTYSGAGLNIADPQNVENFSTNAADHAALRIRRGDPDPSQGNRSLAGVSIYTIGLGGATAGTTVDDVLLKRMANDPSLTPNPVAAGNQGRYFYAANTQDLDQAFLQVASEVLRLAK